MANTVVGGMDADTVKQLNAHIEKIESLEEERSTTAELIKDEFLMAKSHGFDPKIMRIILKMRKRDSEDVDEETSMIEVYKTALGMH